MPNRLLTFSLLALLAAAPLAAQEAPADDPAEPATDAPADGAPDTPPAPASDPAAEPDASAADPSAGLDMGQPVDAAPQEPQPGQAYLREEFGDWSLRCLRVPEGDDPCQLYQLLYDEEGNTVAEINLFPLPPGGQAAAGANIVAPLETLLTEGLRLSVDGANERRYPFTFCNRAGCVARVGFTNAEVEQFKRGRAARLVIVPAAAPDQEVALTVSLTGFTAGFNANTASPPPME